MNIIVWLAVNVTDRAALGQLSFLREFQPPLEILFCFVFEAIEERVVALERKASVLPGRKIPGMGSGSQTRRLSAKSAKSIGKWALAGPRGIAGLSAD
jgi:hypothetical protein